MSYKEELGGVYACYLGKCPEGKRGGPGCDECVDEFEIGVVDAILQHLHDNPKMLSGGIVNHLWSRGHTAVTTKDIKTALRKTIKAIMEEE